MEIWEIVAAWESLSRDFERLTAAYSWLTELELGSSLEFYRLHPGGIDEQIAREAAWTPERVARDLPFTERAS